MTAVEAVKAGLVLLLAALVQVSIAAWIEVAEGHPDVVLVVLVALALVRGPIFGAAAGFWAGIVLDTAALETFGLTSLLLTLVGYWAGRFGDVTTRASAHPPLIAVALGTLGFALGSAVIHFMLGETTSASQFFAAVLVPTLALNMLLAYPLYGLIRRVFPPAVRPRRGEVSAAV
ncbi:MAG TPA: rod shape-determining protein MreD [Gaiellaceae bacterium]|nr:rod shape-determining protein MreD [Gaiellaceae bacterium]